jgi:hypothetical protein
MTTTEIKLVDLLTRIDEERLVIPEFQRGFKWKSPDIKKLLESLLLNFPIGAALLWRTQRGTLEYRRIETVEFSDDGEIEQVDTTDRTSTKDSEEIDFILDGQQRITSIYKLFPNALVPTEQEIDSKLKGVRFFIDLKKLGLDANVHKLTKTDFTRLIDPDIVASAIVEKNYPSLRKEYRLLSQSGRAPLRLNNDQILEICTKHTWLPLTRGFLRNEQLHLSKIRKAFLTKLTIGLSDKESELIEEAEQKWSDWFTSNFQAVLISKTLTCLIEGNESQEGLARIFETINSTGMSLSVFDLLVARLGNWHDTASGGTTNLRKLVTSSLDKKLLQKFDDEPDLGGTASQQIPRILALKSGVELKKGDMLKTPKQTFLQHIDGLGSGLKVSLDTLMQHMGVLDQSYIPLKDSICLIGAAHSNDWNEYKDAVIAYLWAICVMVDWDSNTNEKVKLSFKEMLDLVNGKADKTEFVKRLEQSFPSFEELRDTTTKSELLFRTLMSFNLARGGQDWLGNPRATNERMEDHHVFPKDWILRNGSDEIDQGQWKALRDSVLNRVFVSEEANRKADTTAPPNYLKDLTKNDRILLQIPDSFLEPLEVPISPTVFSSLLNDRYEMVKADFLAFVQEGLNIKSRSAV